MFILFVLSYMYPISPEVKISFKEVFIQSECSLTQDEQFVLELIKNESISESEASHKIIERMKQEGLSLPIIVLFVNRMKKQEEYQNFSLKEAIQDAFLKLRKEDDYGVNIDDYEDELRVIKMELKSLIFQMGEEQAFLEVVSNAYDASCENREEKERVPIVKKRVLINLDDSQKKVSVQDEGSGLSCLGFLTLLLKPHASQKMSFTEIQKEEKEGSIGFMGQGALASLMLTQEPYNGELQYTSIEGKIVIKKEHSEIRVRLNKSQHLEKGLLFEATSPLFEQKKLSSLACYLKEKLQWKKSELCEITLKEVDKQGEFLLNQGKISEYELLFQTDTVNIWVNPSLSQTTFDVDIISQGISLALSQRYNYQSGQSYAGLIIDLRERKWVGIDRSSWNWGQENSFALFQSILDGWNQKWENSKYDKRKLIGLYIILKDMFQSFSSSYLSNKKKFVAEQSIFHQMRIELDSMECKCLSEALKEDISSVSWDSSRPVYFHSYFEEDIKSHQKYCKEPSLISDENHKYRILFPLNLSDSSEQSFFMGYMYAKSEEKRLDVSFSELLSCLVKGKKKEEKETLINQFLDTNSILRVTESDENNQEKVFEEKLPYIYQRLKQVRELSHGRMGELDRMHNVISVIVHLAYQNYIKETQEKYKDEVESFKEEACRELTSLHTKSNYQNQVNQEENDTYFYLVMNYFKNNRSEYESMIQGCCFGVDQQEFLNSIIEAQEGQWLGKVEEGMYHHWRDYLNETQNFWIILYGFIKENKEFLINKDVLIYLSVFLCRYQCESNMYKKLTGKRKKGNCLNISTKLIKKLPQKEMVKIDKIVQKEMEEYEKKYAQNSQRYRDVLFFLKLNGLKEAVLSQIEEEDIDFIIAFKLTLEAQIQKAQSLRKMIHQCPRVVEKWITLSFKVQRDIVDYMPNSMIKDFIKSKNEEQIIFILELCEYICHDQKNVRCIQYLSQIQLLNNSIKENKYDYFESVYLTLRLLNESSVLGLIPFMNEEKLTEYILDIPVKTEKEKEEIRFLIQLFEEVMRNMKSSDLYGIGRSKSGFFEECLKSNQIGSALFFINIIQNILGESLSFSISSESPFWSVVKQDFKEASQIIYPALIMKKKNNHRYELEIKKLRKLTSNKDITIIRMVREIFNNEFEAESDSMEVHLVDMPIKEKDTQKMVIFSGRGSGIQDLKNLIEPGRSGHRVLSDNFGTGALSILGQCPLYYVKTCHQGVMKEARVKLLEDGSCRIDFVEFPFNEKAESFTQIYLPLKENQVGLMVNAVFEVTQGFRKKDITFYLGQDMAIPVNIETGQTKEVRADSLEESLEVDFYLQRSPVALYRDSAYVREFMGFHEYTKSIPAEILKIVHHSKNDLDERKSVLVVGKEYRRNTTSTDIFPNSNQKELLQLVFELLSVMQFVSKVRFVELKKSDLTRNDIENFVQAYLGECEQILGSFYANIWESVKKKDYSTAIKQMSFVRNMLKYSGSSWNYYQFISFSPQMKMIFKKVQSYCSQRKEECDDSSAFVRMLTKAVYERQEPSLCLRGSNISKVNEEVRLTQKEQVEYEKLFSRLTERVNHLPFIKSKGVTIIQGFYIGFDKENLMRVQRKEGEIIMDINLRFLKSHTHKRDLIFPAMIGYLFYQLEGGQESFLGLQERYQKLCQSILEYQEKKANEQFDQETVDFSSFPKSELLNLKEILAKSA